MASCSRSDLLPATHLRVNPKHIAPFGDIDEICGRVAALLRDEAVPEPFAPAAKQFMLAVERMKAGNDPDSFGFDHD